MMQQQSRLEFGKTGKDWVTAISLPQMSSNTVSHSHI